MMPRINGWQRLWIVLSILYFFIVIFLAFLIWPETTTVEKHFYNETNRLINEAKGKNEKIEISELIEEALRRKLLDTPKNEAEIMMANKNWLALAERNILEHQGQIDFTEVRSSYEEGLRKQTEHRKQIILASSLSWILPIVVFYIFGLTICWVIRGFQKS